MSTTLYLEEPLRTLWAVQDPFAAAAALDGHVLRALEGRRTLRTEIAGHLAFYPNRVDAIEELGA